MYKRQLLRLAGRLFGAASEVRNLLYDTGVLAARVAPIPVVSIGGITVGGSGKTPIAADLARRLTDAGVATAVITHGYADELRVHERLCPAATVLGGRDRASLVTRAADQGAKIAVLDSGFQHRKLRRDLDIVAVDDVSLGQPVRRLPAGPFREALSSLARADLILLVRRSRSVPADSPKVEDRTIAERMDRLRGLSTSLPQIIPVRIRTGDLVPANEAAIPHASPRPRVAVAGIMWPEPFFSELRRRPEGSEIELQIALSDHARIDDRFVHRLLAEDTEGGIVCTLKDVSKLAPGLGDVPLWYLEENVVWDGGVERPAPLRAALALLPSDEPTGNGVGGR